MPFFYSSDTQDGKITTLIVNNNTTLSEIICNNYHKITKNYIIESSISDTDEDEQTCNSIINTNIYENIDNYLDRYDIITLHGTLKYINGESPTRYYPNNSGLNESQLCKYNKEVKRFVYDANGKELAYNFGLEDSGTISLFNI